jgi:hypothetical protein
LFALYLSTTDQELKTQLESAILQEPTGEFFPAPEESDFRHYNLQSRRAEEIRAELDLLVD